MGSRDVEGKYNHNDNKLNKRTYLSAIFQIIHSWIVNGLAGGEFSSVYKLTECCGDVFDRVYDHHLRVGLTGTERGGPMLDCVGQLHCKKSKKRTVRIREPSSFSLIHLQIVVTAFWAAAAS